MTECPTSHDHDRRCYRKHRCRCAKCRADVAKESRDRRRKLAYGHIPNRVSNLGAVRRVQGLQVIGWPLKVIAAHAGMDFRHVARLRGSGWITNETHNAIAKAARDLVLCGRGPSNSTSVRATSKGWVSILAWDSIDTDETPADVNPDKTIIDDVRVWNAVNGTPKRHRLTALERRECVRILHARRWTDNRIAHQLGCHEQTVFRIRGELGLAAFEYAEQVKQEAA